MESEKHDKTPRELNGGQKPNNSRFSKRTLLSHHRTLASAKEIKATRKGDSKTSQVWQSVVPQQIGVISVPSLVSNNFVTRIKSQKMKQRMKSANATSKATKYGGTDIISISNLDDQQYANYLQDKSGG